MPNKKTVASCICCEDSSPSLLFIKRTEKGEFPILVCPSCGTSFVWPRPEKDLTTAYYESASYSHLTYDQVAKLELRYHPNSSMDTERIIGRCRKLARGASFLDVGAGFGHYSRRAVQLGFNVSACEPSPSARSVFLQMNGFKPDACCFDEVYSKKHQEEFDVVLLSQVLEHVCDPQETVCRIHVVLQDGGIAVIAVPHYGSALSRIQGERDMFISPPEHLNFFSKRGLIILLERHGFKLEVLETVSKVNRGRIETAVRIPVLSQMCWVGLYAALKLCETVGMGMVINAYFRKI